MKHLVILAALISAPAAASPSGDFQDACEREIKTHLTQPATFEPNYFGATRPRVITFPADRSTSWLWSVPFTAANRFGAVGHYRATCSQAPNGRVVTMIGEDG